MPKLKATSRFKTYEGRKAQDKHVRLTKDMLLDKKFLELSSSAKVVYMYMKLWSCGNNEFEYAISLSKQYMTNKTFIKAKEELIEKGFIEVIQSNKFARIPNKFRFVSDWYK